MSVICARLGIKGRAGVQRGRETAGVPSFLPPRRAPQRPCHSGGESPAEVQRKISRPLGANTLTRLVYPIAGAVKIHAILQKDRPTIEIIGLSF